MIRRFALAAVTAVVCTALVADVAGAFTRREAICVKAARTRARSALIDCRTQATTSLSNDLQACFGDTTGCVSGCLATQAAKQQPYKAAITACQTDQCPVGTDPTKCACKKNNAAATAACGNAADPVACVAQAQLNLFLCNQACVSYSEAGLIEVNGEFNDCLQGCSNPAP